MNMTITSPAFIAGQPIPLKYTQEGENVSPPLEWSDVPAAAKGLVLMLEDADGLAGNFSHWLVYNIPSTIHALPEDLQRAPSLPLSFVPTSASMSQKAQARSIVTAGTGTSVPNQPATSEPVPLAQGKNSFDKIGYAGPMPKPGSGPHHYHFRLFALDIAPALPPGLYKDQVQAAMVGHVIAHARIIGTYERR